MSTAVSLAGRIAKNRQLRLLAAQRRHLAARFMDIFGDACIETTCLSSRHFESTVHYPLGSSCTLRLASEVAESLSESVERVRGAALSVLHSRADLRHTLGAVGSDVFLEFDATLGGMGARAVVHLMRESSDEADVVETARFTATVTAELPLVDGEECVSGVGWRGPTGCVGSDIAICRSSGRCPRDAIQTGFALALAELDVHAVEEQRSREAEAWCYLRSARRDWGCAVLSAFLSSSLGARCAEKAFWLRSCGETDVAQVTLLSKNHWRSLALNVTDSAGNGTLVSLPLRLPPLAFQRILLKDEGGAPRLTHGSALMWPGPWVVSSALLQLCAVLNADVSVAHTPTCDGIGGMAASEKNSFSAVSSFLDAHGVLPCAVPHTVERGLFLVNCLFASRFVALGKGVCPGGNNMPLISLGFESSLARRAAQTLDVRLEVRPLDSEASLRTYHDFLTTAVRTAGGMVVRRQRVTRTRRHTVVACGLLGHLWGLLSATAALVVAENNRLFVDFSVWHPAERLFGDRYQRQQHLASCIAQLFAADAQVTEVSSAAGTSPSILTLSSKSLEIGALPLCHIIGTPEKMCEGLFCTAPPRTLGVMDSEAATDPWRAVENAAQRRQLEQSSYYCPDLLLMIQEMRLALNLPQRSFPTLEFFQRAVHDVPRRVQELAMGRFGDVPVYTRVVARWGSNLRVEAESCPKNATDVDNVYNFDSCAYQHHDFQRHLGPLKLLLSVVCRMYRIVFPNRTTVPLISLNLPTTRRSIDFLLYSWFMAPPQVRCFEIGTRTARLVAAADATAHSRLDVAELTLSHHVNNHIVRAMLFYDFCGQRVLFAETHAPTVREAVKRVSELAVSLNMPVEDAFPPRLTTRRTCRRFNDLRGGYNSTASVLLRALVAATRSHVRVCFVRTNEDFASFLEGTVEVQVPFRQIRCAVLVTRTHGVIPALVAACHQALVCAVGEDEANVTLRAAEDAAPLIPRDDFPHFSARFYTPVNLLGEVLQGVACRYDCTYTIDPHTREVVCLLHVAALAGCENAAPDKIPFPLGIGRGRSKRSAWASAAFHALQTNFSDVLRQVERHKKLCALLHRPDELSRLACREGFTLAVASNGDSEGGGSYTCTVMRRRSEKGNNSEETMTQKMEKDGEEEGRGHDAGQSAIILVHCANRAVDAYLGAADALLDRLRRCEGNVDATESAFTLWDSTSNYGKSVWHACCGALGVAFGGKVSLRFEGGREDASACESELPLRVQLVLRTWCFADKRMVETSFQTLHGQRIIDYSGLTGLNREDGPSVEQLLFASTRLFAEAIGKYLDAVTRQELQQLLSLLRFLRDEEQHCSRLNAKRRMESCIEMTLGCQCRVVSYHAVSGMVTAEVGLWLPGWCRQTRMPVVLCTCTADTTERALSELEGNVQRLVDPLWATVMQSCSH